MASKLTLLSNGTNMDIGTKSFKITKAFLTMIFLLIIEPEHLG